MADTEVRCLSPLGTLLNLLQRLCFAELAIFKLFNSFKNVQTWSKLGMGISNQISEY